MQAIDVRLIRLHDNSNSKNKTKGPQFKKYYIYLKIKNIYVGLINI